MPLRRLAPTPVNREPRGALALALVHRHTAAERDRGQQLLAEINDVFVGRGQQLCDRPLISVYSARETARRGDRDDAIPLMRAAVDRLFREEQLLCWGVPASGVLVETLLERRADGDVAQAEAAIGRLAAAPADGGPVLRELWLLRLRALLARAHGNATTYEDFRDRYATWRKHLAPKGISRGPRQCHDGGRVAGPAWRCKRQFRVESTDPMPYAANRSSGSAGSDAK